MLLMGKSTIFMAIFNSYVSLPEGINTGLCVIFPYERDEAPCSLRLLEALIFSGQNLKVNTLNTWFSVMFLASLG